jgi:hypothetical protein
MTTRLLFASLFAFLISPVSAQQATDANLITAIDVSGSIKRADERLELEGMAEAVLDPRFLQVITRGRHGRIGFVAFTWANGEFLSLVPWTLIASSADTPSRYPDSRQNAAVANRPRDRRLGGNRARDRGPGRSTLCKQPQRHQYVRQRHRQCW